jgi:ABC-type glutathione transport system ATPase component/ABC-type dipeptide/oligopeptide/nickel transport system permease subunit
MTQASMRVRSRIADWRKAPKLGLVGLGTLGVLLFVATAAPILAPYDPSAQVAQPFSPPSLGHPLGINDIGQDILSNIIFGARISLVVGIAAAFAATVIGTLVGLISGFFGGIVDSISMRIVDVALSLPFLPLMIVIGVFLGPGLSTEILVISAVIWAGAARELRSQVLSVSQRDHVRAIQAIGASRLYTLRRHLLPVVFPLVIPQFVRAANVAIGLEASLSFLGLGDATAQSWGTILYYANARSAFLTNAWIWWVVPPGLCIAAAVLAFALIGYALEERARPRLHSLTPAWVRKRQPTMLPQQVPLLRVEGLTVEYEGTRAVDSINLEIERGQVLGIVGASGSGKSTLAAAIMGLLRLPARVTEGRVLLAGEDLLGAPESRLRQLRGNRVALVPQAAMNALNPIFPVVKQVAEAIRLHRSVSRRTAHERAAELLEMVGISREQAEGYPHEFSGGMRQRAIIAMALANDPWLLVVDEPTTGLDPRIQNEILELLKDLQRRMNLAILFISHDLPVVSRVVDSLAVMQEERIVEQGLVGSVLSDPRDSYTRQLLAAAQPKRVRLPVIRNGTPLLRLKGVSKAYRRAVAAAGVDLEVREGEVVGLVGESGAGKSTLARMILGLERPDTGEISFEGRELDGLSRRELRTMRKGLHLVFQDPYQALPDHLRVREIVAEPLRIHGEQKIEQRVREALEEVDLNPVRYAGRYPSELSGGERQRVALARAGVLQPRMVVLDEPTSMLDAELRKDLLESLERLKDHLGISYLCITHDLLLARAFCDRLVVLRKGRVVEYGPVESVIAEPKEAYTQELVRAGIPEGDTVA